MRKLLIFDLDGTTLDSDLLIVLTWVKLYQKFAPTKKPRLSKILTFSGPALEDSVHEEFPLEDPQKVIAYYRRVSKSLYLRYAESFPGTKECFEKAHDLGMKVAINTNKIRSFALLALQCCELDKLVDFVIAGGDTKEPKPSPEGVFQAMALAKISEKSEVLYIGDTLYDLKTAEAAGVDCLLLNWGNRTYPNSAHPRYYCEDYKNFFEVIS
jgi:pyrophosphatase PpaX